MATQEPEKDFLTRTGDTLSSMFNAAMRGGEIQAFIRQGFGEIGAALKAFPDSIQIDEPGALFSPLHSDIAAEKQAYAVGPVQAAPANDRLPTPSQISEGNGSATIHGDSKSLPTPSQIADERPQPGAEQNHGHDQSHEHGRSR